jgi:hypothetical protein
MSARIESKRITNHNTPQLSRMDLANQCAAPPGLSHLNTLAVHGSVISECWRLVGSRLCLILNFVICLQNLSDFVVLPSHLPPPRFTYD